MSAEIPSLTTEIQTEPHVLNRLHGKLGRLAGVGILVASSALAAVTVEEVAHPKPAFADTIDDALASYPDKTMPCEHAPYNTVGQCANYDWGPLHTERYDDTSEISPRGYAYRNCTDWVAFRLSQAANYQVSKSLGNGGDWYDNASADERSSTPRAWDAAVSPGTAANPAGHVALVEAVSADGETMTISEYNHDGMGDGDRRTIPVAGSGFPEFVDFGVHPDSPESGRPSGNLLQVTNTGNGWSSYNLTAMDGVKIAGKPAVLWTPDGPAVFAADTQGKLEEFTMCANGTSWCAYPITEANALAGGVAATFNAQNGDIEIFGPSSDGSLLQIEGNGSSWHSYNVTAAADNLHIEGAPGAVWNAAGPDIFAVSSSGILTQFTTCPDGSGWCTYGILPNDKLSGGAEVAQVGSSIEVFARSIGGHLYQIENPGDGWSMYDITTAAGGVNVQGTPGMFWSSSGPNVFISDTAGRLTQFAWCPRGGWCTYPLTDADALGDDGGVSARLRGGSIELFADSKPY